MYKMRCLVVFFVLLVGLCHADLPTKLPDLDKFVTAKERCEKKGGAGTYDKVKTATEEAQRCIKGLINIDTVKTELEQARKTGSMDEVFGKYCFKRPQIKECLKKLHNAVDLCLEESEKQALNVTINIITQIGDFACYRDGDRIAMFVAEGGVECLQSRTDGIQDCVNRTLKFDPATFSPNSIPNLTVDEKKCDDLKTIQDCVVKDLEDNCKNTTPANIVDALFRFVWKSACKESKTRRSVRLKREITKAVTNTHAKIIAELQEKFKATCEKNAGKGYYEKLIESYNASIECLKTYTILVTPYSVFQRSLTNCTANARQAMRECLTDDEKYYPDFILEMLQALFGYIYKNADKFIGYSESNNEFINCLKVLSQEAPQKEVYKCYKKSTKNTENNTIIHIPPKAQVCRTLREYDCMMKIVKNTCTMDVKGTKTVEDIFKTFEAPCQNKTPDNQET